LAYMEHTVKKSQSVRYPSLRASLKVAALCLFDEDFQSHIWASPTTKTPADKFSFAEAVAFVIDDLGMAEPSALLGDVLLDTDEEAQFEVLSRALSSLLDRIGSDGNFAQASRTLEWEDVRTAAHRLYESLTRMSPP
jgi:hypothetical protein